MAPSPDQMKASHYLADAKAAEDQALKASDPELKESFQNIGRVYRQMAHRIEMLSEEDDDTTYSPKSS